MRWPALLTAAVVIVSAHPCDGRTRTRTAVTRVSAPHHLTIAHSDIPAEEWFQMTIGGRPVGFTRNSYAREVWNGRPGWKFEDELRLGVGTQAMLHSLTTHHASMDGTLRSTESVRESPADRTTVEATYSPRSIDGHTTHQTSGSTKSTTKSFHVRIPAGTTIAPETPWELEPAELTRGNVVKEVVFDTDRLKLQQQTATVGAPEMVDLPGRGPVRAWRVRVHAQGETGDYLVWVSSSGEAIKVGLPIGGGQLVGLLLPIHAAPAHRGGSDFWAIANGGALPALPAITEARGVNVLDLEVTGAPAGFSPPSDGPQTVVQDVGGAVHISVATPGAPAPDPRQAVLEGPNAAPSDTIIAPPVTGGAVLAAVDRQRFLDSTPLLDSNSASILDLARRLTQGAHSDEERVTRLHDWVYSQITVEDSKAPAARASLVLAARHGGSRDIAMLYAALARAAGIPTRIGVGLTYNQGGFWGHAWDESWLGGWTPVDCSSGMFVDATHIKLVEGDSADLFANGDSALAAFAAARPGLHVEWLQRP